MERRFNFLLKETVHYPIIQISSWKINLKCNTIQYPLENIRLSAATLRKIVLSWARGEMAEGRDKVGGISSNIGLP